MLATPELVIFADPGGGTFGGHLAEENGEATLQADGGTNRRCASPPTRGSRASASRISRPPTTS